MKHDRRQFLGGALAAAPLLIPSRAFGANDRLNFGLIGAGGRGRYLQQTFLKLGAECVAVCDVYDLNVANADHQHAPMLFAALDAKKDVYLEKPMSHSIEESQRMIQAVRAAKQIVQ